LRASAFARARGATVGTAAVPLRQTATRAGSEEDDVHDEVRRRKRRAGFPETRPFPLIRLRAVLQAEPAYAPISMPSSMTSTSGLVHFISAVLQIAGGATTLRILIPNMTAGQGDLRNPVGVRKVHGTKRSRLAVL
jgi:hypothetical protein